MQKEIHRTNGTRPDRPPFAAAAFAPPDAPPPGRLDHAVFQLHDDYRVLLRLLFQAIDFFDRCDDCETLIHAGRLFRYLAELAEDCLEDVWAEG